MTGKVFIAVAVLVAIVPLSAENWPQWRGPRLTGASGETNLPLRWSRSENVAWRLPLPDLSGSTPIVWGDRLFLNVAEKGSLSLWAVDRNTGRALWKRPIGGGDRMMRKQNMSTPSPVTDGALVWVVSGTGIVKAFDMAGRELWMRDIQNDYGRFGIQWGYGSSPLLYHDSLFLQVLHGMDTDDPSYVLRLSKANGRTIWRQERPTSARRESPDAYSTPTLLRYGGGTEIVVSGADVVTGHHVDTGREVWRVDGLNPSDDAAARVVASPVVVGDTVIAAGRDRPILAVRAGARGNATGTHVAWTYPGGTDVPTPATDGTYLYVVNDRGIVSCVEISTGRTVYNRKRLRSHTYSASPVVADGRVYITDEGGVTSVFRAGPGFELLAENDLDEYTLSSPAVSDGQIFIRTEAALYAIGQRRGK